MKATARLTQNRPLAMTAAVAVAVAGAGFAHGPWSALLLAAGCVLVAWVLRFFTIPDIRGIVSRFGILEKDRMKII